MNANRVAKFFPMSPRPASEPQFSQPEASCAGCSCPSCQRRADLQAAQKTAAMITRVIGSVASVEAYRDKKKKEVVAQLFIHSSRETVPGNSNVVQHTVNELRRVAMEMIAAADRLEWSQT